jgi:hypothetical protein
MMLARLKPSRGQVGARQRTHRDTGTAKPVQDSMLCSTRLSMNLWKAGQRVPSSTCFPQMEVIDDSQFLDVCRR